MSCCQSHTSCAVILLIQVASFHFLSWDKCHLDLPHANNHEQINNCVSQNLTLRRTFLLHQRAYVPEMCIKTLNEKTC